MPALSSRFGCFVVPLVVVAGCSSQSTPVVSKPVPSPPIELSYEARQVLKQIAADQKFGDVWWLRIDLLWRPDAQFEIHMVHTPPAETDVVYDADGVHCAMPSELTTYLNKVRVVWVVDQPKGRFGLSYENQSPAERDAGRRWLREQEERRRVKKGL